MQGVHYPSPFFDVAHTYLPTTVKQMFRWCRYYYLTNPLISATVNKMSEYPITDILIDDANSGLKSKWEEFLEDTLKLRPFLVEVGLFFMTYGNALVSLSHPFTKWLTCSNCKHKEQASHAKFQFRETKFYLFCKKCGQSGEAMAYDQYLRSPKKMRLILWNPEDIEIGYNELTGEARYYYSVPRSLKNQITLGNREVVSNIPQIFIDSVHDDKAVVLSPDNVFHFKRPSILTGTRDRGWGVPMILSVLKDVFYLQLMKKAQEAILLERIIPLTVIFPQPGSGTSDPFQTVNLQQWKDQVSREIQRWRCVTPESFVETDGGLTRAHDVQVGDLLKNRFGVFEKVLWKRERPLDAGESAFRLRVRGQHAIDTVFSEEHPIWAARKTNNGNGHKLGIPEFIRVDQLRPGDYVGYPIHREVNPVDNIDLADHVDRAVTDRWVYADHTDTDVPEAFEYLSKSGEDTPRASLLDQFGWGLNQFKAAQAAIREGRSLRRLPRHLPVDRELAYVLGLYTAEGSTTPKQVLFSLHKDEVDLVTRLDRFFADRFGASGFTAEKSENGIQRVYSSVIAAQFFHSLIPGTATTKRLPKVIRTAQNDIALGAIRGLLDGDGSYYEDKTTLEVASRQLVEDVRQLFLSWQIMPGLSHFEGGPRVICGKQTRSSGSYRVQVSGSQHRRLMALFNGDEYVGTDNCKIGLFRDGFAWFRIGAVEEVDDVESVIGFQLEGDSTFCTWGVATHNTDRNYIPIMPLPIGNQVIGGDGRALLMAQEVKIWSDQIVAGMGVPNEFVFGGLQYSGSNVSLRMLENQFLGYIQDLSRFIRTFLIPSVASYLGWPEVHARFKPFKMADDLQRKALYLQLNQSGKLSDTTLLQDSDFNPEDEDELLHSETQRRLDAVKKQQLAEAEIQGEMQLLQAKYQAKAQTVMAMEQQQAQAGMQGSAPGEPGEHMGSQPVTMEEQQQFSQEQPPGGASSQAIAEQLAHRILQMSPENQKMAMESLSQRSPELAQLVWQMVQQVQRQPTEGSAGKPLPEQLPPRRGPENAMI